MISMNYLTKITLTSWGVVLLLFGSALAQNDTVKTEDKAAGQSRYKVTETFNVGRNVYVRAITVDKKNNVVWIGSSVGALEIDLKTKGMRNVFTRDHGLANEYVFAIGIDNDGYKWFGTNAGGTSRYKEGKWKTFFPMHGLADYWVYSFATQKNGDLWIGTWAGANHVSRKTGKWVTYLDELINEWVYGIAVDSKDRVWFGTEGGVSMYDKGKWRSWTHEDGLGAGNDEKLPPSPNTGLGTRTRHNLDILSAGKTTYNPNYVFAIHAASDDTIWVGTWGGGVSQLKDGKWKSYTMNDGLAGNIVYSIAQDSAGGLWFGTNRGLSRFDGKSWETINMHDGLFDSNVYAVAVAPGDEVWAGTKHGVALIVLAEK